jgi:hypothetical protein
MTSSASPAAWLPAALARTVVRVAPPAPPARPGGRHLAPETPGVVRIATPEDVVRSGRHTEPPWSRELHDPRRDEVDAFDWLGFGQN